MTGDRVHHCDGPGCPAATCSEPGELLPDGWHLRDGQELCDRCAHADEETYLRGAGWIHWQYGNPDLLPDPGLWADPILVNGHSPKHPLERAVSIQRKRDGYGQLDLLAVDQVEEDRPW